MTAVIALAVQFRAGQEESQREVEREALDDARRIVASVDAEVTADQRLLKLLAGAASIARHDWPAAQERARSALALNPSWRALVLRTAQGEVLLEAANAPAQGALAPLPPSALRGDDIDGVIRTGKYCPCWALHVRVPRSDLVLSLYGDPIVFQDLLRPRNHGTVTGIVDRAGNFLGRLLDYQARVGTPATVYVRDAVARGGQGLYSGTTYEGLINYSAYATSPLTGWSAHVAVDRDRIDGPKARAAAALAFATMAAIGLAGALLVLTAADARARAKAEARLLDMQKAEAISQFTSGVVHDLRNILAALQASLHLIKRASGDATVLSRVTEAESVIERGGRLVNQLLSFGRKDSAEIGAIDVRALLQGADDLIRRSLGSGIDYAWSVDEDVPAAMGNADQLELALVNLATNARDAMNGKGEFRIKAKQQGEMVALEISDGGPGIPEALRDRVFDAYFTTKGPGKGTGLGLAQVAGAIRQANGKISVERGHGGGAQFRILLRAADKT